MKMSRVRELREQYYSSQLVPWLDVRQISGVRISHARTINEKIYMGLDTGEEESDDDIIVDCLIGHLLQTRGKEKVTAVQVVDAAIYLIIQFWSVAATFHLARGRLLTSDSVNTCASNIRTAFYSQQEWLPKSLLRNFTVELFTPYSDGLEEKNMITYLNDENRDFYQYLYHDREYTSVALSQKILKEH